MELVISLEHRFWRTPDGNYWSDTIFPRSFWSRYLSVFDRVNILARAFDVSARRDSWLRVDGDFVSFIPVPAYQGPRAFVWNLRKVRAAIRRAVLRESAFLFRVPGTIGTVASHFLHSGQPYGVEVVADPHSFFARRSSSHPLQPFFQWWFTNNLKKQCRQAACCLYVTQHALQQRYPPASGAFSVGISNVEMPEEAFINSSAGPPPSAAAADNAGIEQHHGGRFRIIWVGSLDSPIKAVDILVISFARSLTAGLNAELVMVGGGCERPRIERLVQSLNVADRVAFVGHLAAGNAVRRQLDASHLFVLPSLSEGLPRVLIEAMARSLPCIGSRVGGIPELLPEAALVRAGDITDLTAKILQFARDPVLRAKMGQQNLAAARRYHESILQSQRVAFYKRLRDVTQAWQKASL